eukprot:4748387-Karenia_brevis.AAC.1
MKEAVGAYINKQKQLKDAGIEMEKVKEQIGTPSVHVANAFFSLGNVENARGASSSSQGWHTEVGGVEGNTHPHPTLQGVQDVPWAHKEDRSDSTM